MDISPLPRPVHAKDLPLERLATNPNISNEEKAGEVSRQFEAILLRQILQQAQKPAFAGKDSPSGGVSSSIYQDLITNQLSDSISKSGTFGLAQSFKHQLTQQLASAKHSPVNPMSPPGTNTL